MLIQCNVSILASGSVISLEIIGFIDERFFKVREREREERERRGREREKERKRGRDEKEGECTCRLLVPYSWYMCVLLYCVCIN